MLKIHRLLKYAVMYSAKYLPTFHKTLEPKYWGSRFLWNACIFPPDYTASCPRRWSYSHLPICEIWSQCYTVSPVFLQQLWYNEIKLTNCRYINRHEPKKVRNNVTPLLFAHFVEERTKISSLQCKSSQFSLWYSIPSKYRPMNFQKQIWKYS